ncbi:MAG: response regulator, partial [Microcystaceae cyanobacterium]
YKVLLLRSGNYGTSTARFMVDERVIHILLVEDDEVDVMNVKRAFKKNNITNPLYIAGNGLEALAMLRTQDSKPPAVPQERRLVLLDLNMPKMNGLEFLSELRSDRELMAIPVIALTTSDEDKDKLEAYNLNVAGYILKPVTFSKFAEVIATLNRYWALCEMP